MASIKLSALVTQIRGKLQGSYFAMRNGSAILSTSSRSKSITRNSGAALQTAKARLAFVARKWATLTDLQRRAWQSGASVLTFYNKNGVAYTPNGFIVFCRSWINWLNVSITPNVVYTLPGVPPNVTGFGIPNVATDSMLLEKGSVDYTVNRVIVSVSQCQSVGVYNSKMGYKKLFVTNASTISSVDLINTFIPIYGEPVYQTRIFFKFDFIDVLSGFPTATLYSDTIVV